MWYRVVLAARILLGLFFAVYLVILARKLTSVVSPDKKKLTR